MKWLFRLLTRVLTVMFDVAIIGIIIDTFKEAVTERDIVAGLLNALLYFYIISVVWNLVCTIFNFITRFDVYRSFGDGLKASFYPLALVLTIPRHVIGTIVYLFRGEKSVDSYKGRREAKRQQEIRESKADPRADDDSLFTTKMEKVVKANVYRIHPVGDSSSNIYTEWEYMPRVTVFKALRKVSVDAKMSIRYQYPNDYTHPNDYTVSNIRTCIDETKDLLIEAVEEAIEKVTADYKGFDGNWSISVNLSHSIKEG